jgi:adenine phosphoribosyltransferase
LLNDGTCGPPGAAKASMYDREASHTRAVRKRLRKGEALERARERVLTGFRWQAGHADVWRLFSDAPTLEAVIAALADPWKDRGVTRVCGIEARGFLLGGAVATHLGVGFVAVRKGDGLFPGPKVEATTEPDYRGLSHRLRLRSEDVGEDDRVLLVDDWAERGGQARAARKLIEACGAEFLGLSVIVDQLNQDVRSIVGHVSAIVRYEELPPSRPPNQS